MPERFATRLSQRLGVSALRKRPVIKASVGVALILLGLLAVLLPTASAAVSVRVAGAILLAAGVFQTALALSAHPGEASARSPALGVANLVAGLTFLLAPRLSVLALTLVLAGAYVALGSYKAVTACLRRYPHWPWMVMLGLLMALFGVLIGLRWPASGLKVIGRFVGINMVIEGATWLMLLRQARHPNPSSPDPATP